MQSTIKTNHGKDNSGTRTLFECNQFRVPKQTVTTDDVNNQQTMDQPSESFVSRKRPMQQDQTTAVATK